VTPVTLVHLSDLHFGRDCDLAMIDAVERLVPTLEASAVVVSGDLTQRARHGEFQAARRFVDHMAKSVPVLTLPGNHDIELSDDELERIDEAAPAGVTAGERYPDMSSIDR